MESIIVVTISVLAPSLLGYGLKRYYFDRDKPQSPKQPQQPPRFHEPAPPKKFDVTDFGNDKKNPYSEN